MEGFTLPVDNQVIFGRIMDRFLERGESKDIKLVFNEKSYSAKITNVNFSDKWRNSHKKDILQIRYSRNGDFSRALQAEFFDSYTYLKSMRESRSPDDRRLIRLPEGSKEYLVIYTTEYDDTYVVESVRVSDTQSLRQEIKGKSELAIENELDYSALDTNAHIDLEDRLVKVRRLNRCIGENLKLLYSYRCQICGKMIGEEYAQHVAEAHHIDYFINSLNNDAANLMIVCPNHHRIIHYANPIFDRQKLLYTYDNGMTEKLCVNLHL